MFWRRRETFPEKRLISIRREIRLVDKDIDALTRTVRSGGQVPPPDSLRSEEWRRRQEEAAEDAMLPDWFPRSRQADAQSARSGRGHVRDEKLVSYLASNFQTSPAERIEEPEPADYRRWILVGLVMALVVLYSLARHWL